MSDYENDNSDGGGQYDEGENYDDDNIEEDAEADEDKEDVSSRSGDSDEENESDESDSEDSAHDSDGDKEYAEDATIQIMSNLQTEQGGSASLNQRVTPPFLTKYEKARIIGTRALQIAQNSPIYVETDDKDYDPIAIAEKEFVQKKIPFIIRRYLPNKEYEDWALGDLEVLD